MEVKYLATKILLVLIILVVSYGTVLGYTSPTVLVDPYGVYVWDIDSVWGNDTIAGILENEFTIAYIGYYLYAENSMEYRSYVSSHNVYIVYGNPSDYISGDAIREYIVKTLEFGASGLVLDIEFWTTTSSYIEAIENYTSNLSDALDSTGYSGGLAIVLNVYLLTNNSLYNSLAELVNMSTEVHWLCYTDNPSTLDYMLDLIDGFRDSVVLDPSLNHVIVLSIGGFWSEPSIAYPSQYYSLVSIVSSRGYCYCLHDLWGYLTVVKGFRFNEDRLDFIEPCLHIVDSDYIPYNYLKLQLQSPCSNSSFSITMYNWNFSSEDSWFSVWSIVFVLYNGSTIGYLVLDYYSRYGLRVEVYVDDSLVYTSSWFHPLFNKFIEKIITLNISYTSGYYRLLYNGVYSKTANLSKILTGYNIVEIHIRGLSTGQNIGESLIDNIVVATDTGSIVIDFSNYSLEPLEYTEIYDDNNIETGTQYIAYTPPTVITEPTTYVIVLMLIVLYTITIIRLRYGFSR